jgi:large subunit ribosomal protein L22
MAATETPREVRAEAKWVRSSARKARLVTDQIRGRSVPEARTILAFSQRAIAREVEKVLNSAVANAESRPDLRLNGDEMFVAAAYADEGPTMKRWRARARGRVARIRKRTCHITVKLVEAPAAPAPPPPAAKAETAEEETPKRTPRKPTAKKPADAKKKTATARKKTSTTRKKKEAAS